MSDERRGYQDPLTISRDIGVRRGMTVVDMGCGPGFFTLPLASLVGAKGSVYAVESNPTMLRHLRSNTRKSGLRGRVVRIVRADVSQTGIPAACADVVLLVRILHDIEDKKAFLTEVRRVCKPGGRVVDLDWKKVKSMKHGPPYEIKLSKGESSQIMKENGFSLTRTFDPGRYHYGLIFRPST